MSKRKTKSEDIRKPEHYFNTYIAREVMRDKINNNEYYDNNKSLDEIMTADEEGISADTQKALSTNFDGSDFERQLTDTAPLAWIYQIENEQLYAAISQLSEEDKLFLTYKYHFCLSQREIAHILKISQNAVSKKEKSLKKYFQKFLQKGCQKP